MNNIENFKEKAKKCNPTLDFIKDDYINLKSLVTATCKEHGDFKAVAGIFLKEAKHCRCPKCNLADRVNVFINKASEIHHNKYNYEKVLEQYVNNDTPVTIICPEHGEFRQRPSDHLKGWGCSKCSGKHKPTAEEWISKMKDKFGDKFDYSDVVYIDNKTPVIIKCNQHNVKFTVTPSNFTHQFYSCPECRKEYKQSLYSKEQQQFIDEANKVHNNKYDYSKVKYINNKTEVCIICPEHGEFWQTPSSHLDGYGCHKCKNKNQVKLFNKLKEYFPDVKIEYEVKVEWLDNQRFDIYFPEYNIAVEYDGEQHFIPIQFFGGEATLNKVKQRDQDKDKKCILNNCKLFRIKYNYSDKIFDILCKNIENEIKRITGDT